MDATSQEPKPAVFAFVATGLRSLFRPGPPPKGWPKHAIGWGVFVLLLTAVLIERGLTIHDNAGRYFGEGRPGTTASVAFLFGAAFWAFRLARDHRGTPFARFWRSTCVLFVYLGFDDLIKVHERVDPFLAKVFSLDPEVRWVDAIDDVIIALYAPLMVFLAWPYRARLAATPWLVWPIAVAFVLFAVMVYADMTGVSMALEESAKLWAALCIALGFLGARMTYRQQAAATGEREA